MKKVISMSIAAISLITLFTACNSNTPVTKETPTKYVKVTPLQKKTIENYEVYTGRVSPIQEINVSGKYGGEVKEVNFNVGDSVKKGTVLYTLDKTSIENSIKSIRSQIESADIQINAAKKSYDTASGSTKTQQLTQSDASLEQAKIQYEDAKKNYDNNLKLYEQGAISKQLMDQITVGLEQAKVAYESLSKSNELLKEKILDDNTQLIQFQIEQAEAAKKSLLIQLNNASESLTDLEVKSPIDGIIASKRIEKGEIAGGGPAFTIVDQNKVYLEIGVNEKIINSVALGQKLSVTVEALSNKEYTGVVTQLSPVADLQTLTYAVRIEIENTEGLIKSGMYAKAKLVKSKSENTLVAERNYFKKIGDRFTTFIVVNNTIKKAEVQVGIDNGKEVEILNGLNEGDQIVTEGREYVKDNDPVTIQE
jgi:HlyD family secretion protein